MLGAQEDPGLAKDGPLRKQAKLAMQFGSFQRLCSRWVRSMIRYAVECRADEQDVCPVDICGGHPCLASLIKEPE